MSRLRPVDYPLGTEQYRAQLVQTRLLNVDDTQIPLSVRIARDGEPTRILGTWPGNGVGATVWTPIMEKLDRILEKWAASHPTHEGKSLIVQIYAGGLTQYLTAAQGMPKKIEERLSKAILSFFWDGSAKHPINVDTLRKKKPAGGKALFDPAARNDAAYVVWLSKYLAPAAERPIWAFLADTLFSMHARVADDKRIPIEMRYNPFCQDWKPNPHKLPFILQQMLRVAKTYDLVLDRPYIPCEVRAQMPAWMHPGRLAQGRENNPASKCLKTRHEASTVEHLEEIAEEDELDHVADRMCDCENCTADREIGCTAPYKCADMANDTLAMLAPKWNLNTTTVREERAPETVNTQGALDNGDALTFHPYTDTPSEVAHLYRIFARHLSINPKRDIQQILTADAAIHEVAPSNQPTITAYACGATVRLDANTIKSGFAVHFPLAEGENEQGACVFEHPTLERAAITAIIKAAESVDPARRLFIVTNSKSAVKKLTLLMKKNEERGWADYPADANIIRHAIATLRRRAATTTIACVTKKHARPETATMERTAERARDAAHERAIRRLREQELETFDAPGARLNGITQKVAHDIIRQVRATKTPARRRTVANVSKIKAAVRAQNGQTPTEEQIWTATRSKDMSRNVRNFIWKGIHGGHKIGDYFSHMPAPWCDYAKCPLCGVDENLQHILFDCSSPETSTIWPLARSFLETRLPVWPDLDVGAIMGNALLDFKDETDEKDESLTRVTRILISESAFLIWKLRCERRIEHEDDLTQSPSADEVTGRWYAAINARIAHDRHLTNKRRYKRKALDKDLVLQTWEGLLELPEGVPENWIRHPGVLVGRGTTRPRGRER